VEFTLGRLDKSLAAYEKALSSGGDRARVLLGMALTNEAMSKPHDAERFYKDAIKAGNPRAKVDYGLFLFKQERGEDGLKILREAGAKAEADRVESALRNADLSPAAHRGGLVRFEASPLDMVVNNGATGAKRHDP
jgi:Tfp pilus assembly protein PilF